MRGLIASMLLAGATPVVAQEAALDVETSIDGTRTLSHELVIPAQIGAVWDAVATIEGWQTWAVPLVRAVPGTDRFETNYDSSAPAGAPTGIEQQWIARKAPHGASFRTTRTPTGFPYASAYLGVISTFILKPEGPDATRVRLSGAGYPAGAEGDALIAFFRTGNSTALRQLHQRFTTGPIDWNAHKVQNKGE